MTDEIETEQPFDAGDPKAVKKRNREVKNAEETRKNDLRWMLSDPRGRRIAWRLLEVSGVFRISFTGNSETFFREGCRNVGLQFLHEILEVDPRILSTMIIEKEKSDVSAG